MQRAHRVFLGTLGAFLVGMALVAACSSGGGGTLIPCATEAECVEYGLHCEQGDGVCVSCLTHAHCGDGTICIRQSCQRPISCSSPTSCFNGLECDMTLGFCVECLSAADCTGSKQCMAGTCVTVASTCTPDSTFCSGNSVALCASDGQSSMVIENCGTQACINTASGAACDTGGGVGGSGGTGGAPSTGGSAGMAGAGTGGTDTGGTGGMGGSAGAGGEPAICNSSATPKGTPATSTCDPTGVGDICVACIYEFACGEWNNCGATSPEDQCAVGGPAGGDGEFWCMVDCVNDPSVTGDPYLIGGDPYDADTATACEAYCATSACGPSLGGVTNALYGTVVSWCQNECFLMVPN